MDDKFDTDVVRLGYDRLSTLYRPEDADPVEYGIWLDELLRRLQPASQVLDLGCGNGIPAARRLSEAGHHVTGIDFSVRQIQRAREVVPGAHFMETDMTKHVYEPAAVDAVIALYSLIHVPLAAQPGLIHKIADTLVDRGILRKDR